jgi:hypothetical protein
MHVIVTITEDGLMAAMTGRDREDGTLINLYHVEVQKGTKGNTVISFEIAEKDMI